MIKRQNKILESKIEPPRLFRNFVARDYLFEQLHNTTEKVIVLNAGAGFGKTMLLAFYAQKTLESCAWYHLNSMDNDIISFVHYLSSAVSKVIPDFQFNLDHYQNYEVNNEFARAMAFDFAYQLSDLENDVVLILDDFQKITNEDIFTFISIIISNTANNVKLLLSMKSAFPKFLARYLLQGTAMVVSANDLAFNKEEIIYMLQDIPNIIETDEIADSVLNYTEGWPVGVMSAVLGLRQERGTVSKNDILTLCRDSTAYDYIMYEVYRKLPYEIQMFLKNTSVLNVLSVQICNAMMNMNNAQNILDYLVQENLFVVKLSGTGLIYQYHSIFKEFLKSFLTEEMRRELYDRAAKYCISLPEYQEQAVEYAILAQNCTMVQEATELIGLNMIQAGKMTTVGRWIVFLLEHSCRLTPYTKSIVGRYYLEEKHYKQAATYFSAAADAFQEDGNEEGYVKNIIFKITTIQMEDNTQMALDYLNEIQEKISPGGILKKYAFALKHLELCLQKNDLATVEAISSEFRYETDRVSDKSEYFGILYENMRLLCHYFVSKMQGEVIEFMEEEQNHLNTYFPVFYDYYLWNIKYEEYLGEKKVQIRLYSDNLVPIRSKENSFIIHMKLIMGINQWNGGKKESALELLNQCTDYYESNAIELPALKKEDTKILTQIAENVKIQVENVEKKHLMVHCFGEFTVCMNDIEVKWRTKKAKEMFAFLFNRNGKPVDREVITEALWPESFYNNTISIFHTTLSYLRKALSVGGYQDIIKSYNKKYYLDMEEINSDSKNFLMVFDAIVNQNWEKIDKQSDALSMYIGDYLHDMECDWHIAKKEKFERLYLKACNVLADHNMKRNQYEEAINYLVKALDIDPYSENLSALLIRCYGAVGDVKRLKQQYEKTKQILKEELNVGLSEIVLNAYEECLARTS